MTCQQNISLFMQTQNCENINKKQYFATSGTFRFGAETTYGLSAEVILSKKAFREIVDLNLNNHLVEINSVKANVKFSFDFAQMVHYPNNSDQVGCLYFKVPRKCSLFGVANEGLGTQVTYLIDEIVDCGKGSNAVISYIHDYLNKHSFNVSNVSLQASNCSGQNKNISFIFYIVSRMLKKMHDRTTYNNFLLEGHTKFTPDRCFGMIEQNYRRGFVLLIFHIATAVNNSAGVNSAELCSVSSRI